MCYRCATNPSIQHHRRHIAAVLSLLSHHGVAFIVALLQFHHRCRGVAFASVMVSSLPLWCRLRVSHSFIVAFVVLPSSSHHHGFIVVVVLPSSSHCHGVIVTVSLLPLWCRLCCCIIMVSLSWFCCRCCGVIIAVLLSPLQCHFCCRIIVTSLCHRCSHVVAWSWSWSWSWSHCGCRRCCCVVVVVVVALWLLLLRS